MLEKIEETVLEDNREQIVQFALNNPLVVTRELNNRSFYHFLKYFWGVVSPHEFKTNWHIEYLCRELELLAYRVADRKPKLYDLIINIPPGTTKTIMCSIMFPAWCWTKWTWMRFICASYSGALSLESADYCRDLIKSSEFQEIYPDVGIKEDKDTKSNFKIVKREYNQRTKAWRSLPGGNRFTTSVGGTLTGFHGDILIVDDPLNPTQAASDLELATANHWMEQTLSTRKTDKSVTPTILVMQRLHQDDPSGHWLDKEGEKVKVKHICLPGEINQFRSKVHPPELISYYKEGLMDPVRLPWSALDELKVKMGDFVYAGQVGQNPVPPGGAMFKVDRFTPVASLPSDVHRMCTIRYWDKAGTAGAGAYTAGVKMIALYNGKFIVEDCRRGRWSSEERESVIRDTAVADGSDVIIWIEQEPGSGGKESAEATIRNLAGFVVYAERPTGDKTVRAQSYSVQVNNGNIQILNGDWNKSFVEEHRFFPYGTYKDQVDAAAGAFNKLAGRRIARRIT